MPKSLSIDKAVDGNLKPVKDSDGTVTALEISTDNVRVKNDLEVLGNLTASNIGKTLTDIVYCGFVGTASKMYLPLNGYIIEKTTTVSVNEYISIVAPYSGVVDKVVMRSEAVCGLTVVGFHKSVEGTENPNTSATEEIPLNMYVDDTAYTFTFTDTASFNAGDILAISFDPNNTSYDTNGTVVFKYNV